jgi:hypothetical protein
MACPKAPPCRFHSTGLPRPKQYRGLVLAGPGSGGERKGLFAKATQRNAACLRPGLAGEWPSLEKSPSVLDFGLGAGGRGRQSGHRGHVADAPHNLRGFAGGGQLLREV